MNIQSKLKLIGSGGFWCKPTNWNEVGTPITAQMLDGLPTYKSSALGIQFQVHKEFKIKPENTVFLVEHGSGLYLINTEGGSYARYIRYIGAARDVVELADEHHQPIELLYLRGGYYWVFVNIELTGQELNGPHETREAAIASAQESCDQGAI